MAESSLIIEKRNISVAHFDRARQELALAKNIDEVKGIRDKAEALRAYAKQAGESLEMQNLCAEIKLRAERRAGELLREQEKNPGTVLGGNIVLPPSNIPKLADIGIDRMESSRWQRIADISEEMFDKHIADYQAQKVELTTASILRLARELRENRMKSEIKAIPVPENRYSTLVIDPPWPMQKILREVRPNQSEFEYPMMALEEIEEFPIDDFVMPDAHLFLWTTQKYLPIAFEILEVWGFRYILEMKHREE